MFFEEVDCILINLRVTCPKTPERVATVSTVLRCLTKYRPNQVWSSLSTPMLPSQLFHFFPYLFVIFSNTSILQSQLFSFYFVPCFSVWQGDLCCFFLLFGAVGMTQPPYLFDSVVLIRNLMKLQQFLEILVEQSTLQLFLHGETGFRCLQAIASLTIDT